MVFTPGWGGFAGQPPGHVVGHGPVDHGPGPFREGLVVPGQPAVKHEPAVGPLYRPSLRQGPEALVAGVFADNLDIDAVRGAGFGDAALRLHGPIGSWPLLWDMEDSRPA